MFQLLQVIEATSSNGRSLVQRIRTGISQRREALEVLRSKQRFYNQTTTAKKLSSSSLDDQGEGRFSLKFKRRIALLSRSSNSAAVVVLTQEEEEERGRSRGKSLVNEGQRHDQGTQLILQKMSFMKILTRKNHKDDENRINHDDESVADGTDEGLGISKEEETGTSRRAFLKYLFNMNVDEDWNTKKDNKEMGGAKKESMFKGTEIQKDTRPEENSSKDDTFMEGLVKRGDSKSRVSFFGKIFQIKNETLAAQDESSSVESSADMVSAMEHSSDQEQEEEKEVDTTTVRGHQNLDIVDTKVNGADATNESRGEEVSLDSDIQNDDDYSDNNIPCDTTGKTAEEGTGVGHCTNDELLESPGKDSSNELSQRGDLEASISGLDTNETMGERPGVDESKGKSLPKDTTSKVGPSRVNLYGTLSSFRKFSRNKNDDSASLQLEENRIVNVEMDSNVTSNVSESFRQDKEVTKSDVSKCVGGENDCIDEDHVENPEIDLIIVQNHGENSIDGQESDIHESETSIEMNNGNNQSVQVSVESKPTKTEDSDGKENEHVRMKNNAKKKEKTEVQIDSKKNKSTSAFTRSLHNALPWLDKKNYTNDIDQKFGPTQDAGSSAATQRNATSSVTSESSPLPSQGGPSSSLIFLSSPPMMRGNIGYPRGMPPSNTESTVTGLLHILLPLLSRLLLLTILSSSALFGFGESNVYSPEPSQHFMLERLHHRYDKDSMALKKALEGPPDKVSKYSWAMEQNKRKSQLKKILEVNNNNGEKGNVRKKAIDRFSRTIIVMDVQTLDRDMDDVISELRDAVSFILCQYHDVNTRLKMGKELEVVVCIESPGGVVQDFGLAADQLARLKDTGANKHDIILTVCVDKIAASGGYMMACQASPGKLLAAPFAVLGSIGVLRETINIHDVLEKYGVQPLVLKAGDAKVPLTQTTKVTEESIAIVQKNLEKAHDAFRDMIKKTRGVVIDNNFDDVTNGDIFLGKDAVKNGLVDQLMTSDEYITQKIEAGDRVLKLHKYDRSRMGLRLSPLDLLLLKSNGLLGKYLTKQFQRLCKVSSKFMNVAVTLGFMKVLDRSIAILSSYRQFPKNHI
jgi:Periplasmic serine proteases (ClpP class)